MTRRFAIIGLGASILALVVTQLPFSARIDVPLFYFISLSALAVSVFGMCWGIVKLKQLKAEKLGMAWLALAVIISAFWVWFWIASFHKHVG